ncbi:MAG: tRNA-2-methylthio-N(6)-dimethylallyladenosine synthase [Fimbriimonadales bacterium]
MSGEAYKIVTWGCQMNEEDSEQISLFLDERGMHPADTIRDASVVILNTCSVRAKPEQKAFSLLGRLKKLKKERPDLVIGVVGCMAQLKGASIRSRATHVDFVVGTRDLAVIPELVEQTKERRGFALRTEMPERKGAVVTDLPGRASGRKPKLKAFVPIQYGCDKFCTFCVVPVTRGRERSRPTEDILREVRELVAQGTREVTLLGQTVNSYGKNLLEGRVPFHLLLRRLAELEGLERIRFTSPYPRDFSDELVETIRDVPQVMEHVHLPLQSGDDEVLQRMKRVYSVNEFLHTVERLREAVPHIGITTDLIVGFPGETEEQFQRTLDVVREVRFDSAFMFAYSTRPGTKAAEMPDQVPEEVKAERLNRLIDLQNGIAVEKNRACVGREFEVLIEGPSDKDRRLLAGYTREFRMMHFPGGPDRAGRLATVRATEGHLWGMMGELA